MDADTSQNQLRTLQKQLASIRECSEASGASKTVIWYWTRGANCLREKNLRKLEAFLLERLRERVARLEAVTRFVEPIEGSK